MKAIIPILILLALGGAGLLAEAAQASEPGAQDTAALHLDPGSPKLGFVRLADVKAAIESDVATATGKVAFNENVTSRVASPVSGRVQQLHVQPGDKVKKGQALVTIASPDVESARAEAIQANSDLQSATRELERAKRLYAEQAIAQKDLQSAEQDVIKAKSNVERTRARLQVLNVSDKDFAASYVLRSPLEGTVVTRDILPGQEVRSDGATPLMTVADLSKLWVLADVYERDLARVKEGDTAEVRVAAWPAEVWKGTVKHVGEVVDPATRTVKVRIEVPNPDGRLKPEMFAKVTLTERSREPTVTIPVSALISDGERNRVIVADAQGNFRARDVEVGPEHEGQVRVLGGLQPGEKIVVEGALYVKSELEKQ